MRCLKSMARPGGGQRRSWGKTYGGGETRETEGCEEGREMGRMRGKDRRVSARRAEEGEEECRAGEPEEQAEGRGADFTESGTFLLLLGHFSRPTLCDPIDGSPPGSSVPGILQARILEWVAI